MQSRALAGAPISIHSIGGIPVERDDFRAHRKDERVHVNDFESAVKTFTLLLRDLAGQEK